MLVILGAAALAIGVYAVRLASWKPAALVGEPPADGRTRVGGVVHVHTTLSDGGGTPEEVIAAARVTGTRFVVITDHNNLDVKPFEGERQGVLVIVGTEISTNAGHVLGLGIPDPTYRFSGDAIDALEDIRDLGGQAFAAHPLSPRPDFVWSGWELSGWSGLELLNGDSQWREAGWWRLARMLLFYRLNRPHALLASLTSPDATLARFDRLLSQRNLVGIAGADAHSRVPIRKDFALRFPSYESLFALMRNYVVLDSPLSDDSAANTKAVLDALAAGRSYIAVDALAPGGGLGFDLTDGLQSWTMGDTVPPAPGLRLRVWGAFAPGARARVLHDGKAIVETSEIPVTVPVEKAGVYRCEVRLPGWNVPWILSNPIYVFDEPTRETRRQRGGWPAAAPPPEPRLVVDHFDSPSGTLSPEHDPTSKMPGALFSLGAGRDRTGAIAFSCDLAQPTPARPDVYCALMSREARDLSGYRGLMFWIRGDGEFRTWVQIRDRNPASADGGLEYWYASARSTPEWRPVILPFSRFHSFNPKTDRRLDLDQVKEIAFVIDKGALKGGASARIWLDDLTFY